jgi:hypothetical protein
MLLEIQTSDSHQLLTAIIGNNYADTADISITDSLTLRHLRTETYRGGADVTAIVIFALSFPVGIATNVIADLIGEYLKRHASASAPVEQARLILTVKTERIEPDGTRIQTESSISHEIATK